MKNLKNLFKTEKTKPKHLVGLEITTRPWNKIALIGSLSIFLSGFALWIIPVINPITMGLAAFKFLGKFG